MKLHIPIPLLTLGSLLTSSAFAQAPAPASVVEVSSDFDEEGLSDEDTQVDLEAEALPTTNKFGYLWEQFRGAAITTFTFNAEKKAAQYRLRLHSLDRKLAACSEIGDEECLAKVEKRMQQLSDRTEKYIAKREELKEQFLTRFQGWRAKRESRIKALEQKAAQNEDNMEELLKMRSVKRVQAINNRKAWKKEARTIIKKDREQLNKDVDRNREQLIELRSKNVKQKLDQAREKVQLHQNELDDLDTP